MNPVLALVIAVPILVVLLVLRRRASGATRLVLTGGAILCYCLAAASLFRVSEEPTAEPDTAERLANAVTNRPIEDPCHGYVGSDACQSCHTHEHATWHSSWHRTMTQLAAPDSVIGDFDTTLYLTNVSFELWREGDGFFFDVKSTVDSPTGKRVARTYDHEVVMTTGSHHMQVYWYSLGNDTRVLGMLPFTYLKRDQRWVPRNATFLLPPAEQEAEEGRWNTTCIKCHTTYGRVDVGGPDNVELGAYLEAEIDTRVGEFGISCEACHGPGEQHVQRHQSSSGRRTDAVGPDDTITHPAKLSHRQSSQVCGQCHGRLAIKEGKLAQWRAHGLEFRPGQDLEASSLQQLIRCTGDSVAEFPEDWEVSFWSDGMTRISSNEYSGLIESPCFQRGELSCIKCHQLHQSADDERAPKEWADDQLGVGKRGNQACTQCHSEYGESQALTQHTHHPAESAASNCYNCHMPYTTYGLLKAIRSHQIHSPDVAASVKTGRPNACNQCHLDRTLAWSAEHLSDWYGIDRPELTADQESVAASVLWLLRGDAGQRALMAWSYGWKDAQEASQHKWMPPFLAQLLQDPYHAVRYIAGHSLRQLPGYESMEYDFLGEAESRAVASLQVLRLWSEKQQAIGNAGSRAILIDESGQLLKEEFNRLLKERDDRDVLLNE